MDDFYPVRRGSETRDYRCKPCQIKRATEWHRKNGSNLSTHRTRKWKADNPETVRLTAKEYRLKYMYGITAEFRSSAIERQGNKCGCCGRSDAKRLVTEHDHQTGEVRGFVCDPCNLVIGWIESRADVVKSAVEYLKRKGVSVPHAEQDRETA